MYAEIPDCFSKKHFEAGKVVFSVPISDFAALGSSGKKKRALTEQIRSATKQSLYIFTSRIRISLDIYQSEFQRIKNPNSYDIDNLGKPILDALSGSEGLYVDDSLIERVMINWIDSLVQKVEVEVDVPFPGFMLKTEAAYVRSGSWCFPFWKPFLGEHRASMPNYIASTKRFFDVWNSIRGDDDFAAKRYLLPLGNFVPTNKLRDRGFDLYDLEDLANQCMPGESSIDAAYAAQANVTQDPAG